MTDLTNRNEAIFKAFRNGETLTLIARRYDRSLSRVRQIVNKEIRIRAKAAGLSYMEWLAQNWPEELEREISRRSALGRRRYKAGKAGPERWHPTSPRRFQP